MIYFPAERKYLITQIKIILDPRLQTRRKASWIVFFSKFFTKHLNPFRVIFSAGLILGKYGVIRKSLLSQITIKHDGLVSIRSFNFVPFFNTLVFLKLMHVHLFLNFYVLYQNYALSHKLRENRLPHREFRDTYMYVRYGQFHRIMVKFVRYFSHKYMKPYIYD